MFTPLANRQAREFIDTMQLHETEREIRQKLRSYRGTMAFRNTAGHDYLVKWHYDEGARKAKIIGKRNAETEALEKDFNTARNRLEARLKSIEASISSQAKLNVAVGLGRLPDIAARILRAFERKGVDPERMRVVGTNALYAYEALAGGRFDTELISTQDIDLLLDSREALAIS
ncbi:MAG: GSU2403 family nucleotidyltransferase fold protein, partial [Rhizobiaceae bacterium]